MLLSRIVPVDNISYIGKTVQIWLPHSFITFIFITQWYTSVYNYYSTILH